MICKIRPQNLQGVKRPMAKHPAEA